MFEQGYRILAVDDDPRTQESIRECFQRYRDWTLRTAGDVETAKMEIDRSIERDEPFDAYLLDIGIPLRPGGTAQITFELEDYIRQGSQTALIAYLSGFLHDEKSKAHLSNPDPTLLMFEKPYLDDAIETLHARLHGDPIQEELRRLFGQQEYASRPGRLRARQGTGGVSLTHRLGRLTGRIGYSWPFLDPKVRDNVRAYFDVDEDGKEKGTKPGVSLR